MTTRAPKLEDQEDPVSQKPAVEDLLPPMIGLSAISLIRPRWLAIGGQLAAVLIVKFGFGFPLPLVPCLFIIAASVALNIVLLTRSSATKRLTDREASYYLGFDMAQLTALLYLTGGLHNPFVILFLAPVAVSASSLSTRSTIILMVLGFACVSFLGLTAKPLPWIDGQEFELPVLYQWGLWIAILLGLSFSAAYASRIAREARSMSNALAASQYVLAREQRLSAVGGLAAAAAHELGTPLGTIALIAKDLEEELADRADITEDIDLLMSQVHRCRDILGRLSANPTMGDAVYDQLDIGSLLHEVVEQVPGRGVKFDIRLLPHEQASDAEPQPPEPQLTRRPEIIYGLGNFVDNAADFAKSQVTILADWGDPHLRITIEDDGPGFPPKILESLGEPYLTTRLQDVQATVGHDHQGLGLGVFIAKTLIERTGGKITFSNGQKPGVGARVDVSWPEGILT